MVKVKEDLSGMTFGRLLVIEQTEDKILKIGKHIAMWKCLCSCQKDKEVKKYFYAQGNSLRNHSTTSCGCYRLEQSNKARFRDLTNMRFGKLIALEFVEYGSDGVLWRCVCDCKNYKIIPAHSLLNGNSKSCGCSKAEAVIKNNNDKRTENHYEVKDDYVVGYTSDGKEFYFDVEDLSKIRHYKWFINRNGYVATVPYDKEKRILLHRYVMNLSDDDKSVVDHIGGDKTRNDNRKSNLRICTQSQNQMNKKLSKRNTSGVSGVGFDKSRDKWYARIGVNNKIINLGRFDTKEEAIRVRKDAEKKYHGEFSYEYSQKLSNKN